MQLHHDTPTLDIGQLIDGAPISRFQWRVFLLCSAVAFFDGVDTQVIGAAAPALAQKLGFARGAFGVLFASGLVGAMLGALVCGMLADHWGRKRVLVFATFFFGAWTLVTPWLGSFEALLAARFMAGLGLGGAVPCFVATVSEYAPGPRRSVIVSTMWAAFPLGAMCGGFLNALLLETAGWPSLFYLWGGLPLLLAVALYIWLPESARFLMGQASRRAELEAVVRAIRPNVSMTGIRFVQHEAAAPGAPVWRLLSRAYRRLTVMLWIPCFLAFGAIVVIGVWTPALLTHIGLSASQAAVVVGFNGMGSLLGTALAGRAMQRFGTARTVAPAFVLASLAMALYGQAAASLASACALSLLVGFFLGVCTSSGVTLAAMVYPTAMRSTGIGWALGMGRFGQVAAPLLVGLMVAADGTVVTILGSLAAALLLAVPCVLLLGRVDMRAEVMPVAQGDGGLVRRQATRGL